MGRKRRYADATERQRACRERARLAVAIEQPPTLPRRSRKASRREIGGLWTMAFAACLLSMRNGGNSSPITPGQRIMVTNCIT